MKFSIVVPLYNKAPYIKSTLDAVLAQTYRDFELIVINDGSTDGGEKIVESISDHRLKLIRQANSGVSATRNHGIDIARGEWIAFLDADDWHHPRYLEALVSANQQFPHADTLATGFIKVPSSSGKWPPAWPSIDDRPEVELITDLALRWMSGQTLFTSSAAVRATRLKQMQPCFAVGESFGEDLDLWFRLAELSPVALVKTPLAAYRVDVEDSLTTNFPPLAMAPYLLRMRARAHSGVLNAEQSRSALWLVAQHEVGLARQALADGRRLEGLRWLWRGRDAATGKRWWMTVAMTLFFPGPLVRNWQEWRVQRTTPSLGQTLQEKN